MHRGAHTLAMEATVAYEEAREKVATFINAPSPENIVFVRNTTEAINLVAHTWAAERVGAGDRIVTTEMEHHSNLVPWQHVAQVNNAELRLIAVGADHTLDLSDLDELLTPNTRLVALTHMSNVLGTITPVKEITEAAHRVGARVLVDAAQSVPHMPVDVQEIGCDFMAFSGHKMVGPTGIGALYISPDVIDEVEPFLHGGEMVLEVTYESATWNRPPMKFEAGTPNIADAIALGAAVDYLRGLGMESIREHEIALTNYALERFRELEDVEVYGPTDLSVRGGVVSFYMSGIHPTTSARFWTASALRYARDTTARCRSSAANCTSPRPRGRASTSTIRSRRWTCSSPRSGRRWSISAMQMPDRLDDLYKDIILDHYRRPRKQGLLPDPDLRSEGFNPFCGDQVVLTINLDEEGRIGQTGFEGEGCSISQASASMLAAHLGGQTIEEAEALIQTFKGVMQGNELTEEQEDALGDIISLQGVREFPIRIKCALLGWTTLQDAIADYRKTQAG